MGALIDCLIDWSFPWRELRLIYSYCNRYIYIYMYICVYVHACFRGAVLGVFLVWCMYDNSGLEHASLPYCGRAECINQYLSFPCAWSIQSPVQRAETSASSAETSASCSPLCQEVPIESYLPSCARSLCHSFVVVDLLWQHSSKLTCLI